MKIVGKIHLYNLIYKFTTCVRPSDATVVRFNSPAELTGRTGRACIFYGRTGGGPNQWRILGFCHSACINSLRACVRLSDATVLRFNSPAESSRP
jgi:hypothetical protein